MQDALAYTFGRRLYYVFQNNIMTGRESSEESVRSFIKLWC